MSLPAEFIPAARAVVAALRAAGVDHAFTVPGESFLAILDELSDDDSIRTIATRHENGAAFAAEAYAKLTRRPAACLATRAVGAANLAVGIHTALQDSSPVIALIGQVSTDARHREAFQEIDLERFLGAATKWTVEADDPATLGNLTRAAARLALEGRQGPTAVAFREDLLTTRIPRTTFGTLTPVRPHASPDDAADTLALIRAAERPLILAGLDVIATRAGARLAALAEREHVPVAAIWRRPDAFPNDHHLYVGHSGLGVLPCVTQTLRDADLWVVLGDRLDENTTSGYSLPGSTTDLVHVHLDAGRLEPRGAGRAILAAADTFLDALLAAPGPAGPATAARDAWATGRHTAWVAQSTPRPRPVRDGYVDQFAVHAVMRRIVPRGSVIVTDAGNFSSYASRYLLVHEEGTFVAPVSGAMGYAVPACIGAKLARPDRLVIGTAGDGGFLMTANELQTAAREGVAFTLVVFDNATYGTIRMHQERRYPGRPIATALGETDLAALARSLGVSGVRVGSLLEFEEALAAAFASTRATVIVVPTDPEQVSAAMHDHELAAEPSATPPSVALTTDPGDPMIQRDTSGAAISTEGAMAVQRAQVDIDHAAVQRASVETAVRGAVAAAPRWASTSREGRALACEAIAQALDDDGDAIVEMAVEETHLAEAALRGELARTAFQWRFFAEVVREGSYLEATVDHPRDTPMGPQPDLRRMLVPVGPVAVFGASNFPLAFSTGGGDTASALAIGCPVIVKSHPSHHITSALTARAMTRALTSAGAPEGAFSMVEGLEAGVALVEHSDIRAVAFTGSLAGGRALLDRVNARPAPVPFYGELSSINPVIVLPGAADERGDEIAAGLVGSYTVRGGQLCTKPGLVFVPAGRAGDALEAAATDATRELPAARLLSSGISAAYGLRVGHLSVDKRVRVLARGVEGEDGTVTPALVSAPCEAVRDDLLEECFGPATLLARYGDLDEVYAALARLGGSLTGTVHHGSAEEGLLCEVLARLAPMAGRLIVGGYPTGVHVGWAQHHGGPWPATNTLHTSVGAAAARRFLRPLTWQDAPAEVLPSELRDGASLVPRRVDGRLVPLP